MQFTVAMKVSVGTRTRSSRHTPARNSATCSAAEPLEHATACFEPTYSAKAVSNRSTKVPALETHSCRRHSCTYSDSRPRMFRTLSGMNCGASDIVQILVQALVLANEADRLL